MCSNFQVHVGETMENVGARAIHAWHRMERGEEVDETHVSFENWEALVPLLSPKGIELLGHLFHQSLENAVP